MLVRPVTPAVITDQQVSANVITAVWDDVGTRARFSINKKTEDFEKFTMRCLYLMQYWMDLGDCIGKFHLFHEGFPSVLFVSGDVWCVQSYGQNEME